MVEEDVANPFLRHNKNPPAKPEDFTYNAHRAMLQAEPQGS